VTQHLAGYRVGKLLFLNYLGHPKPFRGLYGAGPWVTWCTRRFQGSVNELPHSRKHGSVGSVAYTQRQNSSAFAHVRSRGNCAAHKLCLIFLCNFFSLLATCSTLVYCLAYSSTLKMEATFSSEMSVDFQRTIPRYIPEDRTLLFETFSSPINISRFTLEMYKLQNRV
jgi:hypothetical protein